MKIGIVMGSKSDWSVVKKALDVLESFEAEYEAHVFSAHRTPQEAMDFAAKARERGFGVIIAFAGMAAHLAGVLAACTTLPVIAVPVKGGAVDGLDALLSCVMMPPGVPVATVGLNSGANAALLALQILAVADEEIYQKLAAYKTAMRETVLDNDRALQDELK